MKKRFIVALNSSTGKQNEAFRDYIKENGIGWWHWIKNVWLIHSDSDELTARKLRDDLCLIYPDVHMIVLEISVEGDTWSGFGPRSDERNMFTWLKKNWRPD